MPLGYVVPILLLGGATAVALTAPRRPAWLGLWVFLVSVAVNELPFFAFYLLLITTVLTFLDGDLNWIGAVAALAVTAGLSVLAWRGLQARGAIVAALGTAVETRLPWPRILLRPIFRTRMDVKRVANLRYGEAGRRNLLDVYHHKGRLVGGPVLIHWHGGHYRSGRKNTQSLPLLYRLASQGWVCISANYRLQPRAGFAEHLADAKKVLAWAHEHASDYGADADMVFVSGSSAGGHLASMAALTQNDPAFQPGFEAADTSVTAAIALGAYLGPYSGVQGSGDGPLDHLRPDAPPFFVVHGANDTLVPVEAVRDFVEQLRERSTSPVLYAELPGGHHAFDLYHSPRFEMVINGIEVFASDVANS